jgi:hypothetical protein
MIKKIFFNKYLFSFVYLIICLFIFGYIKHFNIFTDIQLHVKLLITYLDYNSFPIPPLYYFCIYLISFFHADANSLMISSVIVLTIASLFKYKITLQYLNANSNIKYNAIFAFCLMFFFPIVFFYFNQNFWYLGKFTANIWHNSTTIFVFPFCLYLFFLSIQFFKKYSRFLFFKIIITIILILLIKPSFLFAFIPTFPLMFLFFEKKINIKTIYSLLISLIAFILLVFLKIIIYNVGEMDNIIYSQKSEIIIAPFKVFLLYTNNILFDVVSSFLFHVVIISFLYKKLMKDYHFIFAIALVLISLIIYFLLAEAGPRFKHGNFYWQVPISMFILNMVLTKHLIFFLYQKQTKTINCKKLNSLFFKKIILTLLFLIHFFSGVFYLFRLIWHHKYY